MKLADLKTLIFTALFLIAVIGFMAIFARAGEAQASCGPLLRVTEALASRYGEAPVARGMTQSGNAIVVFAGADGATFTLIVVAADGTACLAASGLGWQIIEPGPQGEPS